MIIFHLFQQRGVNAINNTRGVRKCIYKSILIFRNKSITRIAERHSIKEKCNMVYAKTFMSNNIF